MQLRRKSILIFASILMAPIIYMIVQSVNLKMNRTNAQVTDTPVEIISKRTPYNKVYIMPDGSFRSISIPKQDVFLSSSTALGNRRMLMAGHYIDYTVDGNPEFLNTTSLIQFEMNLPSSAVIKNAFLKIYHYGSNDNFNISIGKVTSQWDENSIFPGPQWEGDYGNTTIPIWNTTFQEDIIERDITIDPKLIYEMQQSNYGLILYPTTNANSAGIVFCSNDIDNFCIENHRPQLIIEYDANKFPLKPQVLTPSNNEKVGPIFNSNVIQCDITGASQGCKMILTINTEDPDNTFPLQTEVELTDGINNKTIILPQDSDGIIEHEISISDGNWKLKARTKDILNDFSDWTDSYTFFVDTTKPALPLINEEPEFTAGSSNTVFTSNQLNHTYQFQAAKDSTFTTPIENSTTSYEAVFNGLSNEQRYYYRVRTKDDFGNISDWSKSTYSIQDNIYPVITNLAIIPGSNTPIEDDIYTSAILKFNSVDKHWNTNKVEIITNNNNVLYYSGLPQKTLLTLDEEFNHLPVNIYKIRIISTDKAGNTSINEDTSIIIDNSNIAVITLHSNIIRFHINRDVVPPPKPQVKLTLCEQNICAQIYGEPESTIVLNGQKQNIVITKNGSITIIIFGRWKYNTRYTYRFALEDSAENVSEYTTSTIDTPYPTVGKGGIPGASETNPYSNEVLSNIGELNMNISINLSNNDYYINSIEIPAPKLTLMHTSYDNKVEIYGIGVPKHYQIKSTIHITYLSFNEAKERCGIGLITAKVFIDNTKKRCMEKEMGIDSIITWMDDVQNQCRSIMPGLQYICINQAFKNKRHTISHQRELNAEHSMISFHIDNSESTYIDHFWNDNNSGKFQYKTSINEIIKPDVNIKARTTLFGEFEEAGIKVIYNRMNTEPSNSIEGLRSGFSNSLCIDKSEWINIQGKQAKILDVPYFNQLLEPDGTYHPPDGWQMCGAASAVMVAGYFDKLPYDKNNPHSLKKYMYSDSGQGISGNTCGVDKGGAFELTNWYCGQSWNGGILKYLEFHGLKYKNLQIDNTNGISFSEIRQSIENMHPIIIGLENHILVIKGYTVDGKVIVNDSYKNYFLTGGYSLNGDTAIYSLEQLKLAHLIYAIEVTE